MLSNYVGVVDYRMEYASVTRVDEGITVDEENETADMGEESTDTNRYYVIKQMFIASYY